MANYRLLLVEDDISLGYLLTEYLKLKEFSVTWVKNGIEGLEKLKTNQFDLCILDVMMPVMDGFTLAEKMKENKITIPFLFLTARSLKIDVLKGYSLGAVEFIKKPIDEEELVVRLNSLLGILKKDTEEIVDEYEVGTYIYYPDSYELQFKNDKKQLTVREGDLLLYLLKHKNSICTHSDILNTFWNKDDYFNRKSLNVFITRLRKYLAMDDTIKIENIHNQGFKMIIP